MLKNIGLFLLAFSIACIFWLATVSSQQNIKSYENPIPVKLFNTPEGMHAQTLIENISIKIDSIQTKTPQIQAENFQAFIDLSEARLGTQLLPIQVKSQDANIRIVSFYPSNAEVILEKTQESSFQLTIEKKGNISPNLFVENISGSDESVVIRAGNQTLKNIKKVVAFIEINNQEEPFRTTVPVQAFDKNNVLIQNIDITPKDVTINVEIHPINEEKIVGIKLNTSGNITTPNVFIESLSFEPNIATVQAKSSVLQNISHLQTEELDLSSLKESQDISLKILPPENAEIVSDANVIVHVIIKPIN